MGLDSVGELLKLFLLFSTAICVISTYSSSGISNNVFPWFSMANIPASFVSKKFVWRSHWKMRWHTVICCHTWTLRSNYHLVWLTNWATHGLLSRLL